MIILPDGTPLDLENIRFATASDLLSKLGSELKSTCDQFLDSPACVLDSLESVHVVQGEFAEVLLDKDVNIIGSSDATTCFMAVLIDHPSGRALVCHHDETTVQLIDNIIQGIVPQMQSPELYLVGGALTADEDDGNKTISTTTVTTLLHVLHSLSIPITLKLFCALAWNTDPITRAPLCQSLAVSLKKQHRQQEMCTAFAVPPGGWKDNRGPLIIPRLAQIWLDYGRNKHLRSVYDANKGQWNIKLLEGASSSNGAGGGDAHAEEEKRQGRWIDSRLLDLSDADLLQCCSTSPECELPHIAGEIRTCLQWALAQRQPLRMAEHRFQFNKSSKCWEELPS
jgi:hypothetical protein